MNEYMDQLDASLKPTVEALLEATAAETASTLEAIRVLGARNEELTSQMCRGDGSTETLLRLCLSTLQFQQQVLKLRRSHLIAGIPSEEDLIRFLTSTEQAIESATRITQILLRRESNE